MFNLEDAQDDIIDINFIKSKVSEYDIWKQYCRNFEEINKPFLSELYNDRNPSCRIYQTPSNRLMYKDFGTGEVFSCFDYIQVKYGCNFKECLRIVYNDFKLGSIKIDVIPQLVLNNAPEALKKPKKAFIEIVPQAWTIHDYNYWNQYHIPLDLLDEEEIYSCEIVYLHTSDGRTITYNYSKNNPIYAYKEYDIDLNFIGWKIYFPLSKKENKWLSNSSSKSIQGIKTIKRSGKILGITKARKDCLCYKLMKIDAIALYNENGDLDTNRVIELIPLYDFVFVNFDPDDQGMKATDIIYHKYGLKGFYMDEYKDLSDYIKNKGLLSAKRMINKKIRDL